MEASQTFLEEVSSKCYFFKIFEEDDFLDLWLGILGFPDYILFFNKQIIICYLLNSLDYIHLYFKILCLNHLLFQHLSFSLPNKRIK